MKAPTISTGLVLGIYGAYELAQIANNTSIGMQFVYTVDRRVKHIRLDYSFTRK